MPDAICMIFVIVASFLVHPVHAIFYLPHIVTYKGIISNHFVYNFYAAEVCYSSLMLHYFGFVCLQCTGGVSNSQPQHVSLPAASVCAEFE